MPSARTRRSVRLATLAAPLAAAALAVSTASPAQAAELREGGLAESTFRYTAAPSYVPGSNDWSCRPGDGRNPVILIHGTFTNAGASFVKAGPRLKNAGYCLYSFNYGMTITSLGRVGAWATSRTPPSSSRRSSRRCAPAPGRPRSTSSATARAAACRCGG